MVASCINSTNSAKVSFIPNETSGFSAAAGFPSWSGLLQGAIKEAQAQSLLPEDETDEFNKTLQDYIEKGGSDKYDRVAQMLQDELGYEAFHNLIAQQLKTPEVLPETMMERRRLLSHIPFKGTLATVEIPEKICA